MEHRHRALLELCLQYWHPVYSYLRHCGHSPDLAEDIARAFFEELLQERLPLARAAAGHVRFRGFLIEALHRFLVQDWRELAGARAVALTPLRPPAGAELEARHLQPAGQPPQDPAAAFKRSYALTLISLAYARLAKEAADEGRAALFEVLAPYLGAAPQPGQLEDIARRLSTRPLVLAIAMQRLRQRFQELVREELAETVSDEAELSRERAELLSALQ